MTTTDLITRPPAIVVVAMMDANEARESIAMMRGDLEQIDVSIVSFRARALDFKDRQGWRSLGYSGFIEAIRAECGSQYSKSYLSRLIQAAEIERVLELPLATPESHLRPLGQLDTPDQRRAALGRADELAAGTPRTARHVQQAVAEQIAPFWQARSDADPTAHLWTRAGPSGAYHYRAACGVTARRPPDGSTGAEHCSSCVRTIAASADIALPPCEHCGKPATTRRNLRGLLAWRCDGCAVEQARLQADEESEAGIIEAATPYPDMRALRAALDRAERLGAVYDPMQQRADGRMPILAPPGFGSPGERVYCDARELSALCDSWERSVAAPQSAPATADMADIRQQAAALLRALAPLMAKIETEDIAALSDAITDLAESPERREAPYWINVGWALLDLEPDEVTT